MSGKFKVMAGFGLLFTDVMLVACCLEFTVMTGRMEYVHPNLLLWYVISVAAYFGNCRLCRKKSSMAAVFASNVIWMAAMVVAACVFFQTEPRSMMLKIVLGIALAAIQGHGCYLAYFGAKAEQTLVLFDAGVAVAAIFLYGCEHNAVQDALVMQVFCFVALIWLLVIIICLRTGMGQSVTESNGRGGKKIGIFILLGVLFAVCGGICTALMLKLNGALYSLGTWISVFGRHIKEVFIRFQAWLQELVGQMPDDGTADAVPDLASGSAAVGDGAGGVTRPPIPGWLSVVLGIAALVCIAVFIFMILRRLQKEKASVTERGEQQTETVRVMTEKRRKTPWGQFKYRLTLYFLWIRKKETAEGLAIALRRRGKRSGVIMQPHESWQAYVRRLSDVLKEKAAGMDGQKCADWEKKADGLDELADFLEHYFYSRHPERLSKKQYSDFKKCLHW